MRVLVTGASGLLGLNLALEASSKHVVYGVVHHQQISTKAFTVLTADLLDAGHQCKNKCDAHFRE